MQYCGYMHWSRTGQSRPAPNQKLATLTIWNWISNFGIPDIIQSDQGTHFIGKHIQDFIKLMKTQWDFCTAYNPTAAGSTETWNGLIKA